MCFRCSDEDVFFGLEFVVDVVDECRVGWRWCLMIYVCMTRQIKK